MKIAMVGWEYPPYVVGGLGVHCAMLTRELAHQGVDVHFYKPRIGPSPTDRHLTFHEVDVNAPLSAAGYELSDFWGAVAEYNRKLPLEFDPSGVSLLHCHDWIGATASIEISRRYSIPLVVTVHSTEYDRSAFFNPQPWIMDIERSMVNGARRVIAVSGYTKRLVCDHYGRCEGVSVIHNGFNPPGIGKPDYSRQGRIIFLGRLTPQKGPRYLVQAAAKALEYEDFTVVFAGSGSAEWEIRETASRLGISPNIRLLGRLSDLEIAQWMVRSDAYVLPAVSEPFGMTVLEAMSTGLPTLISKTTGVGEALFHALRFDFWDTLEIADLIIALERSESLRRTLGTEGMREASKFTWEKCGALTLGVYREVVASG